MATTLEEWHFLLQASPTGNMMTYNSVSKLKSQTYGIFLVILAINNMFHVLDFCIIYSESGGFPLYHVTVIANMILLFNSLYKRFHNEAL